MVWNVGLVLQWGTNLVPNRAEVSFRQVAINQVTVVPARLIAVGSRFFTDRGELVSEVEQEDMGEMADKYEEGAGRDVMRGSCRRLSG